MEEAKVAVQEGRDMAAQAEAEEIIALGYKAVKFNKETVYIRHPNMKESNFLQKDFASRFNKMLKGDLPTRRELSKTLEARGAWTKKDDDEIEQCRQTYVDYYKEWYSWDYNERIDNAEFDKLDKNYSRSMGEYMQKHAEREQLFSQSIESAIESDQIILKLQMCVVRDPKTDEKYFKTIEELENFNNAIEMQSLITACTYFWAGVGERFLEQLPENTLGKKSIA